MKKVVYNTDYGGFSLSKECFEWMADRGHPAAIRILDEGRDTEYEGFYGYWDGPRHEALLVMAVEALGENANGTNSSLGVHTLKGNRYYIDEYDGSESVVEPHTINWTEV